MLQFDSRPEIAIFIFCKIQHNMNVEYQPSTSFSYEYKGNEFMYMPDFKINGKFYEYKGEQFFRINESTGEEEMYVPWRQRNLSSDEYISVCEKEEVKHQCMLSNGIIILREKDIKNLTEEMFR